MTKIIISSALALDANYQANKNFPVVGYEQLATPLMFSSTTAADGFPVDNLGNVSTNQIWKGIDSGSDEYITVVAGGEFSEIDYVGLARHNLFTVQGLISVEWESSPGSWTVLVSAFTPDTDGPLILRFVKGAYQSIRLRIQNATADPYIAVMYVGKLLKLERKIYVGHTPAPLARKSNIVNAVSESGNFLGRIILSEMTASQVSMTNLTPVWVRDSLDDFIAAAKESPFFFAWRPYDYPDEVSFAWMTDNPQPTNQLPNGMMSCSFSFTAIQK